MRRCAQCGKMTMTREPQFLDGQLDGKAEGTFADVAYQAVMVQVG
jgi:hypothetical protein